MDEAYAILDADLANFSVWLGSQEIHVSCRYCDYRYSIGPVATLDKIVFPSREHDCEEYQRELEEAREDRRLADRDRARAEMNAQLEKDRGKTRAGRPHVPSKTDTDAAGAFN